MVSDNREPSCQIDTSPSPIAAEPWWPSAEDAFSSELEEVTNSHKSLLLLYGADADGFSASYFLHRALSQHVDTPPITRAVWNFDYDFRWLPRLISDTNPALVICLDIPIIRETTAVEHAADQAKVAIYDHHIVPDGIPTKLARVVFVNSRDLGGNQCNYPASAFGAAFASQALGGLPTADLAILAAGLIGDRAEDRNKQLFRHLYSQFPTLDPAVGNERVLFRFTYRLNCLFRAGVHATPVGAEETLAAMMAKGDPARALREFDDQYRLAYAATRVQRDIDGSIHRLSAHPPGELLCDVLPIETFSVGAIAGKLAGRGVANVVALGFPVDGRVAFELRTGRNGPDLTSVLAIQRSSFVPLSAGGHPMAAGALIPADAVDEFKRTLADALDSYRDDPQTHHRNTGP